MEQQDYDREALVATIRASCPSCGDVELTSAEVTALVCSTTNESSYAFQCPECDGAVVKPADSRIVDLLVASGVRLQVWSLPAELDEPKFGDPITYDDVLEFHFELQQDGWFERMAAMEMKPTGKKDAA
jgi:hypothetical protein